MNDADRQRYLKTRDAVIRDDLLKAASKHQVCRMVAIDVARGTPGEPLTVIRNQGMTVLTAIADADGDAVFAGDGPMLVEFDGVRVQFPVDTDPGIVKSALFKAISFIEKAGGN